MEDGRSGNRSKDHRHEHRDQSDAREGQLLGPGPVPPIVPQDERSHDLNHDGRKQNDQVDGIKDRESGEQQFEPAVEYITDGHLAERESQRNPW